MKKSESPEFFDTKVHILRAGKELLLAAQGALSFCQHYVETSNHEKRNPELALFFAKALSVVNHLTRDLKTDEPARNMHRPKKSRPHQRKTNT